MNAAQSTAPCSWNRLSLVEMVGVVANRKAGGVRAPVGHADQHRHQQLAQAIVPGWFLQQQSDNAAHG